MDFELVGDLTNVQTIAVNLWMPSTTGSRADMVVSGGADFKGVGYVRLVNGHVRLAEVHWYEAHGVGRRKMKIKQFFD